MVEVGVHALDEFAAVQVVLREREARDRCWWNVMAACFHVESEIKISWFQGSGTEFTAASQDMVARGVTSRHRLGPPTVRICGNRALVLLPAVVETYPLVDDEECVLSAYCRLFYRLRRDAGVWTISGMQVIYERDELRVALPGHVVTVALADVGDMRASYRLLAWTLGRTGYAISQDLPGDDRPDLVEALYADAFRWLGMSWPLPS